MYLLTSAILFNSTTYVVDRLMKSYTLKPDRENVGKFK